MEGIEVGRYLDDLMGDVARATPGPLSVDAVPSGGYALTTTTGKAVAVVNRRTDADLFARAWRDLRGLVAGLAEALGRHRDDGTGHCAVDGQRVPCKSREDLEFYLARRDGSE